jgi:hypothetical protein
MPGTSDEGNGRKSWVETSRSRPCLVCGKKGWCRIRTDGRVIACRRQEQGCYKTKSDKNGAPVFLHSVAGNPIRDLAPDPSSTSMPQRADADTLNSVYQALLDRLKLSQLHSDDLRKRGLAEEVTVRNGYRSLPLPGRARIARALRERFGDTLLRVPGFVAKEGDNGRYLTLAGAPGLLVPVRDLTGRILGLKIRRDVQGDAPNKYVWLSSSRYAGPGPSALPHVPLGVTAPVELVRLSEGPLKCDSATALSGVPSVAAPGVSNWRVCLPVLREVGAKTIRLSFDSDCRSNKTVARALLAAAEGLSAEGFGLELETWDAVDGKGIDDVLVAGKSPAVLQGDPALEAVRSIAEAAGVGKAIPENDLDRLTSVLANGGAEALFRDGVLLKSLAALALDNQAEYAAVRASIKGTVSVRDLDKALQPIIRQLRSERPVPPVPYEECLYFIQSGRICRNVMTKDGPVVVPLCNFDARIVEEVTRDDGAERSTILVLEGGLTGGRHLPRAEIPAEEYPRMEWVTAAWGSEAIVNAGAGTRDHVRCALQVLSHGVRRRTVYAHTGWRKVADAWLYLHAAGAIGPEGPVEDVETALPDALHRYELPEPPRGTSLAAAVRASLGLLQRLAPDAITFSLLSAPYRAVLGDTDFALHLAGPTGCFKSEMAALVQQHFGPGLDARHLPGSWSSTGNALEGIAFAAKDALLVVDDFAPTGTTSDVQRFHREADRLLRAQGNRAGRQRMRADATLRPVKPPRGLILSTGEDTPRGQSLRSRMFVVEVSPGNVNTDRLTACQKDSAAGLYAQSLAAFVAWLSPRYEIIRGRLRQEQADLREKAKTNGQHARTPGIIADLASGLRCFLDFAQEVRALTPEEADKLWERGWSAFLQAASDQVAHIAVAEPTNHFLRLLMAALASGRAHVAAPDGTEPKDSEAWGWRGKTIGAGEHVRTEGQPQGKRIGWIDDDHLYLEPEAVYAEAQELARHQGESLAVSPRTLNKRLHERGLLAAVEAQGGRTRFAVRRTLEGQRREVLCLRADSLTPSTSAPSAPADQNQPENGRLLRLTGSDEVRQPAPECAYGTLAESGVRQQNHAGSRRSGGLAHSAHSETGGETISPETNSHKQISDWGDWQ